MAFKDDMEDAWLESLPKGAHACPGHDSARAGLSSAHQALSYEHSLV